MSPSPHRPKRGRTPRAVRHPGLPRTARRELQVTPLDELRRLAHEAGLPVPEDALERLLAYLDAMLAQNTQVNLTAIREPARARILHVLDSLHVREAHAAPQLALDLGSGNGFPGVAIAALWPAASVLLVERTQKKVRAIESCLASAGLRSARVVAADAAQLPALRPELCRRAQLVTLRAVAPLATCLRLAAPFLAPGGVVAVFKASELGEPEASEGAHAARQLRLVALPEHDYVLPGEDERARRLLRFRAR